MLPLRDSHPTGKFPFWVAAVIAVNAFVFFLELTASDPDAFITQFALIPALVDFSKPATLLPFVTSQFLHAGFIHILSNMWFLWIFGDNVEERLGFLLFPIFYISAGVIGGFLQYIFISGADIPMLGASGAIAGILGAYLALFPRHTIKTLVPVFGWVTVADIPASFMLFYWFFIQLFAGVGSLIAAPAGGVAWFAHVGGFVIGWVVGRLFLPKQKKLETEEGEVIS